MAVEDMFPEWSSDDPFTGEEVEPAVDLEQARAKLAILSAGAILERQTCPEDFLFADDSGHGIFSTIDFCQVFGETGAGKTLWSMSLAASIAAGCDFIDWRCASPRKVVYVDGELAEATIRQRVELALFTLSHQQRKIAERNLLIFSREMAYQLLEVDLAPLESAEGQWQIEQIVDIWGAEAIIFDSRFCLLGSDMKEQGSMPKDLIRSLRTRRVFQLWVHHTGKAADRGGYGDKTAEFLMDTNIQLISSKAQPGDIKMEFKKARKCNDENSHLYRNQTIRFQGGEWLAANGEAYRHVRKSERTIDIEIAILRIVEKATKLARESGSSDLENSSIQDITVSRQHVREQLICCGLISSTGASISRADRNLTNKCIQNLVDQKRLGKSEESVFLPNTNFDDSDSRTPKGGYE